MGSLPSVLFPKSARPVLFWGLYDALYRVRKRFGLLPTFGE